MANESQETVSNNLNRAVQQSTDSSSIRGALVQRLKRSRQARANFVDSNISKALAFQIRSLRDKEGWSQQVLADKIGTNQNAVYRAENPNYGKQTITTLKKIAAAFDVALVVRFAPFSELLDWVNGTPRINAGLTTAALEVSSFTAEDEAGVFDAKEPAVIEPSFAEQERSDQGPAKADLAVANARPSQTILESGPFVIPVGMRGTTEASAIPTVREAKVVFIGSKEPVVPRTVVEGPRPMGIEYTQANTQNWRMAAG